MLTVKKCVALLCQNIYGFILNIYKYIHIYLYIFIYKSIYFLTYTICIYLLNDLETYPNCEPWPG